MSRELLPPCPKCLAPTHRCTTGECLHCDQCDHTWIPTAREMNAMVTYRCACSWVGGDPDFTNKSVRPTCPACWKVDRKRRYVFPEGTPYEVRRHNRPAKKVSIRPTPWVPDLFREGSKVSVVLRWMIEQGEVSGRDFKAAHVALGGTQHSTHAFDRYFAGKDVVGGRYNTYVPMAGGHSLLERIGKGPTSRVRWIGSLGSTFEEGAGMARQTPDRGDRPRGGDLRSRDASARSGERDRTGACQAVAQARDLDCQICSRRGVCPSCKRSIDICRVTM